VPGYAGHGGHVYVYGRAFVAAKKEKKRAAISDWNLEEEGPIRIIEGPYHLDGHSFEGLVRRAGVVFLINFHIQWAVPCKQVAPFIDALSTQTEGRFYVGTVNVERCPELAKQEDIVSVPTIVLYNGGVEVERIVGANTTMPRIRKMVRDLVGSGPKTKPFGRAKPKKAEAEPASEAPATEELFEDDHISQESS
jgi:thioredoxin-like negative regulator of GroEL